MKIVTMGLGYIGLPTSIMLASHGHEVYGVDVNVNIIDKLNKGQLVIEEFGLEEPFQKVIKEKKLQFFSKPKAADAYIIAVPTPNKKDKFHSCDLSFVESAVKMILPYLAKGNMVIIESTIAPRTMSDVVAPLLQKTGLIIGKDIFVAHCPERVLPGNMMQELKENTRIIGGLTEACTHNVSKLYQSFVTGDILQTSAEVAELTKLMENTYRDTNIALANEFIKIGNELEIDALEAIKMANKHPRVNIHSPGPGVGGHCLAVDPYFISAAAPKQSILIQHARAVNSSMPKYIAEIVDKKMKDAPTNHITVLGLTYKGNIDDIRESPSLEIIERLKQKNYDISLFDPHVSMEGVANANICDVTKDSSMLLVLTDHNEFKNLQSVTNCMARKLIIDTKEIVNYVDNDVEYVTLGNIFKM